MLQIVGVLFVFVLVALVFSVLRDVPEERGQELDRDPEVAGGASRPLVREYPLVPWLVGAVAVLLLLVLSPMPFWIAVAAAAVVGVASSILLRFLHDRRLTRFQYQLADAIDLMVSTLRAGGGLTDALLGAAQESGRPLRGFLSELVERVRIGEEPEHVLADLEDRVPLESFRLFTFTLAAHWRGGGSLATTLSNVGRSIRDRVDVSRRVSSQAIETQVSVVFVVLVTYGLALFMWLTYPERMDAFVGSELGAMFIALAVVLQAVGLFWIAQMTRIEV